MREIFEEREPQKLNVTKFIRYDPQKITGAKSIAKIKVWMINEKQKMIRAAKVYHFKDPYNFTNNEKGKSMKKIIHTTNDGEAFIVTKNEEGLSAKDI